MERKIGFSTLFTLLMTIIMLIAAIDSLHMPFMAGVYPGIIAGVLFVLGVLQVIQDFRKGQTTAGAVDIGKSEVSDSVRYRKGLRAFIWVLGYYLAIILLGFKLGSVAYLVGYLKSEDRGRNLKIVIICAGMFLLLDFFRRFLDVWWPVGLLGDLVEEYVPSLLPWLF